MTSPGATGRARRDGGLEPLTEVTVHTHVDSSHHHVGAEVRPVRFGLDTFGDRTNDREGRPLTHAQTIRNVVEQGVLADSVGVDYFGIGEHHTAESRCRRETWFSVPSHPERAGSTSGRR